jgi:hypothetical protein
MTEYLGLIKEKRYIELILTLVFFLFELLLLLFLFIPTINFTHIVYFFKIMKIEC